MTNHDRIKSSWSTLAESMATLMAGQTQAAETLREECQEAVRTARAEMGIESDGYLLANLCDAITAACIRNRQQMEANIKALEDGARGIG